MSNPQPSKGFNAPLFFGGLVLAVAGSYLASTVQLPFQDALAKQGLPINIFESLATIGVFGMVFPAINIFFITPLRDAITDRTTHLEHTFTEVETLRSEMDQLKVDYERRLAETEANAREQIQGQIKEAQNLRQQLMAEASAKADEMRAKATSEIEQERHRVLTELRLSVVDLTMQATEKLLGETVDSAKNRRLVQDFIDTAEAKL